MELQVGEHYSTSCAEISMDDGQIYYVPVFDLLHADTQFGFPHMHYHIDGRFHLHPRIQHLLNVRSGHTASVIVPEGSTTYRFIGIVKHQLKCERLKTGLAIPANPTAQQQEKIARYNTWYNSFIGRSCEGKKCPHYGTEMLEKDGYLVCPMHDLHADRKTLKVIPKP